MDMVIAPTCLVYIRSRSVLLECFCPQESTFLVVTIRGSDAAGIWWVEVRDEAKHSTMDRIASHTT